MSFFLWTFFHLRAWKNNLFTGLGSVCKVKNFDLGLDKTSVTVFHYTCIFKAHSMLLFCKEVKFFWCNKKVLLSYIHETCNLQDKVDMYMLWIHLSTLSLSMVGCFILISWLLLNSLSKKDRLSLHISQVVHQARANPCFSSTKGSGTFQLLPGWDTSPSHAYPPALNVHIPIICVHLGGERHFERKGSYPKILHNISGLGSCLYHLIHSQAH